MLIEAGKHPVHHVAPNQVNGGLGLKPFDVAQVKLVRDSPGRC